jgi:hypothetical protein
MDRTDLTQQRILSPVNTKGRRLISEHYLPLVRKEEDSQANIISRQGRKEKGNDPRAMRWAETSKTLSTIIVTFHLSRWDRLGLG